MLQIENDVIQLFKDNQVQVVEITMNGLSETLKLTEKDIVQGGLTVDKHCVSGNSLEIGSCSSAQLTLTLTNHDGRFNDVLFEGGELFVRIGIKKWNANRWENAQLHFVPMGYFTVDETPRKLTAISLVALDRMVRFDKLYDSDLMYPATIDKILADACKNCNVPLKVSPRTLLNYDYVVPARPAVDNLTYRQMIGWVGEITGTCAHIDCDGKLDLKWYTPTDVVISSSDRYTSDVQETSITITGVKITGLDKEKTVYSSGQDGYVINIAGNELIQDNHQAVANSLGNKINGFTYLPYSCTAKPCPYLQPLDMVTFVDKNNVFHSSIVTNATFKINQRTELKAVGESAVKKGYASTNPNTNQQRIMIDNLNKENTKLSDMLQATIALNDVISNSLGLYRTSVVLPDGSTKTYLHDKPKLESSFTIYTMTEGGFAWTKSGWNNGNPVWQYGIDKDGNAVLNTIVANALTAVHITGGLIEGTTIKGNEIVGGMLSALSGDAYFDLNLGKLFASNATLKGTFQVDPPGSTTKMIVRDSKSAIDFVKTLYPFDGSEDIDWSDEIGGSLDYMRNDKMVGTLCFSNIKGYDNFGILALGASGAICAYIGLGLHSASLMFKLNENDNLSTYVNGTERSEYTDRGMSISGETTTDDLAFNSVEEIKTNITEATIDALSTVKQTKIYNYDLKKDKAPKKRVKTTGKRLGFVIGRDVPPELLGGDGKTVSVYNTVATMWKAIQELERKVERLESEKNG